MNRSPNVYRHALVRPPGDSFARALSSRRLPIDPELARRQHAAYCDVLRRAGFEIEALAADEGHPDSCFMQDPALVVAGRAVLCRMGAPSRAGEPGLVEAWLRARFPTSTITAPGTIEGGDILLLPDRIVVGLSGRTNAAGVAQLRQALAPAGLRVEAVPVDGCLHLLSAVTFIGHNTLMVLSGYEVPGTLMDFDIVRVPSEESGAADALGTGNHVILPEGCPRTARELERRGFHVLAAPLSEFAAADGGVTCLALVW